MSHIHNATGGNADAPSTAPRRDCIHGQLARSCEICELTAELAAATKHANDIGDLLAKVEAERDALAEKVAERDGELETLRRRAGHAVLLLSR